MRVETCPEFQVRPLWDILEWEAYEDGSTGCQEPRRSPSSQGRKTGFPARGKTSVELGSVFSANS